MRKIVDSNFLQSERLREYLSKSSKNCVVLTDYASMEAYKGDTLASIYLSMEILAQYPKQIVVLKDTQTVCGLRGRKAGLQRRLIDEGQTREFSAFCTDLLAAKHGSAPLQRSILDHGREATAHMEKMLADVRDLVSVFGEVADTYTDAEVKILRTSSALTECILDKFVQNILQLAAILFRDHPRVTKLPDWPELPNMFIFRIALCLQLLVLDWISVGSPQRVRSEKLRNDLVDINFAAYATYFDGLLTADRKLERTYQDAVLWLSVFLNRN